MDGSWFLIVGICVGGLASWLMFRSNIAELNQELEELKRKQS
jgi:hypothetical protein